MKRFRVVATSAAEEGMCLYDDVRDRAGNVLLPKLTALTGAMLASLARREIEVLLVVDGSITEEQLAAERLRVQERLAYLCRHAGDGRANALLRAVVAEYRMAGLS
jgi:hypothetical protein